MARIAFQFVLFSFLLLFILPYSSSKHINYWCTKTPFPDTCSHFISQKNNVFHVKQELDFTKLVMEIALEQALHAQNFTLSISDKIQSEGEKVAWKDCSELFDRAINKLNQAINGGELSNVANVQTWLTMAQTNIETCQMGLEELGILQIHDVMKFVTKNISELLSNALAMNQKAPITPNYDQNAIPSWVLSRDYNKKILDDSSDDHRLNPIIVVAKDGSGNFTKIKQAFHFAAKSKGYNRFVIYVKEGIYNEYLEIGKKLNNITLVGDGIGKTIITGKKTADGTKVTTFNSATVGIGGDGFIGRDVTIRNMAGRKKAQAVALRSDSDLSVYYRCSFEGYQDTLYVHSGRQFYRECDIYGTVDFIFGNAQVTFQKCNIYARKPRNNAITITASKRSNSYQNSGFIIHESNLLATEELVPVLSSVKGYLGRPWDKYSRVVVLNTYLDRFINPEGWLKWNDDPHIEHVFYAEYNNSGPGSSTENRVNWTSYHSITDAANASEFTVGIFLLGDFWLPYANVSYESGLW